MNADAELALQQASDAFGLDIAQGSATWTSQHVARLASTDGSAYAFKYFRSPAIAEKEACILLHLAKAAPACQVQKLHRCMNGETLASTALGPMMATRWIDGASKPYDQIDKQGWALLGRSLASLHLVLESFQSEATENLSQQLRVLDFDSERTRILRDRDALRSKGVPEQAVALQEARLRLLEANLEPCVSAWPQDGAQLIHNDYNVHNYIFDDDGELHVIDWDRALFAPREYEVVRCLNHLPLESAALASGFLAGYRELGSLDDEVLKWAVHAAMVSHACKHWPTELALAVAPGGVERLIALEPIVNRLDQDADKLQPFFQQRSGESN